FLFFVELVVFSSSSVKFCTVDSQQLVSRCLTLKMTSQNDNLCDVEQIRLALQNLYSTSNSEEQRRAAHNFLLNAQSVSGNWQHFLTILKNHTDPGTAFFACNSLYSTLAFGWHNTAEFEGQIEPMLGSFVEICENENQAQTPAFVANKVCSTLAVCMLRALMLDLGPAVVENLQTRWASQHPQLLLKVFEELPVQLDKITLRLEERSFLRAALHKSEQCIVSSVLTFLHSFYQRGFDPVDSLKLASSCAETWLYFTKNIDAWKVTIDSFLCSMLDDNSTVVSLGRLFCTLVRQEKLRDYPEVLFKLFEYVGKIRVRLFNSDWSTVVAAEEFDHPVTVLMDMVSTLAEQHVQFMLRHVDDARVVEMFETLIALFGIPIDYLANADFSCVVLTSTFWESLNYQLYHEVGGTVPERDELLQRLARFYLQLLSALLKEWHTFALKTIHVPPNDHTYCSCEEAFQSLICCCYNVLGSDVLAQLRYTLQEKVCQQTDGSGEQQPLSSAENDAVLLVLLNALKALSEEVAEHDDQIGVVLQNLLPLVPRHTPKMLCALLDVLITYSSEIHHKQLYEVAVPIVLEGLRHAETATAASHALNEITCHRVPVIMPWADALFEAALHFADRTDLQLQDRQSAMRSVGHIVSILPDEGKRHAVITAVLAPRLNTLKAISGNRDNNSSVSDGLSSTMASLFVEFSLLTHFTNSVNFRHSTSEASSPYRRHPSCIVMEQCYPSALEVYQSSGNSADVAHWICSLVDASLFGLASEDTVQTIGLVGQLVQSFTLCKGLITLVQNCIMIVGEERWRTMQLSGPLSELFNRITGAVAINYRRTADEDLLETYLRMCHKLSVNCWWFCTGGNADLQSAMELAMLGAQCKEIHVVRSTKLFLTSVFGKQKRSDLSHQLANTAGPGILIACFERNEVEPLGQNVEALGDVFAALVRYHGAAVRNSIAILPQHQLVSELLEAAVNNARQFSTTWKTINMLCRKGALQFPPISQTETTMK
ncbi:hypothetical protein T4B_3040, partial [Trichinella pseudospiralis]